MTVKKAYPNNGNGGGGTGEANTASTEGGLDITLPKDGDNLPFRGPNSPSGSLVEVTQQATTIDFDLTDDFKTITGTTALDGFTVLPELTVVDGATTFGIIDGSNGPGQIQFVNRNTIPYEIVLVDIPANASIPIVHTGSRVVWLSYSYNFNTSTLTLHQDLASPGIDLSDQKILYSNLNYKDDGIGGTLNVLEFGTPEPYLSYDNTENLRALTKAAGGIRISGLVGTAEAATTSVNITAGVMSRIGGNVLIDANNSWQLAIPELLIPSIVQKFANSDSSTQTFAFDSTLDTTQYSDGTTLQPWTPTEDDYGIFKIAVVARNTATPSIETTVTSFQPENLYKTEAEAITAAESGADKWTEGEDTKVFAPAFYVVCMRGETDFSNATFIAMQPRRGAGGGGGSGAATSGYNEIQNNGVPLTQRQILNLLNATSVVDNAGNESTDVTFPGGAAGIPTLTQYYCRTRSSTQTLPVLAPTIIIPDVVITNNPDVGTDFDGSTGILTPTGSNGGIWTLHYIGNTLVNGTDSPPIMEYRGIKTGAGAGQWATKRYPYGGNTVGNFGWQLTFKIRVEVGETAYIEALNITGQTASIQPDGLICVVSLEAK